MDRYLGADCSWLFVISPFSSVDGQPAADAALSVRKDTPNRGSINNFGKMLCFVAADLVVSFHSHGAFFQVHAL